MGSQRNQREDGEGGGAERGPEPLFFPRGTLRRHGTQKKGGNRSAAQGGSSTAPSPIPTTTKAAWALSVCCRDFPDGHIRALTVRRPEMYVSA